MVAPRRPERRDEPGPDSDEKWRRREQQAMRRRLIQSGVPAPAANAWLAAREAQEAPDPEPTAPPCCYYHDHMPPGGWTLDATRSLARDFSLALYEYLDVHPVPVSVFPDSEDVESPIEGRLKSVFGQTYWGDPGGSELHVPSLVFELVSSGDVPLPLGAVALDFPSFDFRDWFAAGLLATPQVPEGEGFGEEDKRRSEPEPDLCAHCGQEFQLGDEEGWMDYITFEEVNPWDEAGVHIHVDCMPAYGGREA